MVGKNRYRLRCADAKYDLSEIEDVQLIRLLDKGDRAQTWTMNLDVANPSHGTHKIERSADNGKTWEAI